MAGVNAAQEAIYLIAITDNILHSQPQSIAGIRVNSQYRSLKPVRLKYRRACTGLRYLKASNAKQTALEPDLRVLLAS
jgi:hypothetical protein